MDLVKTPGPHSVAESGARSADGTLPAIELVGIAKRFHSRRGVVTAVERVDLVIGEGEFFSLLGPSGCGKTTTLRMIGGFEEPTEGQILLYGKDVVGVPPNHRDVNMVFQSYALFPHMSVFDNVAFGLRRKSVDRTETARRVNEMLELVQLEGKSDRRPRELSGGQQQRVALARALVNHPRALLLDEPLAALDLKLRQAMQLELKRIQREVGITFIFVTHDQNEALTMSDRLVVMNAGRIEQLGAPREVYERPRTRFVAGFIGTSNLITGTVRSMDARHRGARVGRRRVDHRPRRERGRRAGRRARSTSPSARRRSCSRPTVRTAPVRDPRPGHRGRLSRHRHPLRDPVRARGRAAGVRAERVRLGGHRPPRRGRLAVVAPGPFARARPEPGGYRARAGRGGVMTEQPCPRTCIRGLTQPRLVSRRRMLGLGGLGRARARAGRLQHRRHEGRPAARSAGRPGATRSPSSGPSRRRPGTLDFTNWPLYIDVGKGNDHPSLDLFTHETGIKVTYREDIQDDASYYGKIAPVLQVRAGHRRRHHRHHQRVRTDEPVRARLAVPLDQTHMANFYTYASDLAKDPAYDRGNVYTMPWASGITGIGYNPQARPAGRSPAGPTCWTRRSRARSACSPTTRTCRPRRSARSG